MPAFRSPAIRNSSPSARVPRVVMMLVGGGMRVALATTHLPLKEVPAAITRKRSNDAAHPRTRTWSQRFGIAAPRILGGGPQSARRRIGSPRARGDRNHRSRAGTLRGRGHASRRAVAGRYAVQSPMRLAGVDCVLAMYHDQGLPVLKYASFGSGVNVTLGLPVIRTSVDHGTALDLAGSGQADAGSLRGRDRGCNRTRGARAGSTPAATRLSDADPLTTRTGVLLHHATEALRPEFFTDRRSFAVSSTRSHPRPGDLMVEIGPGLGALTRPLLERVQPFDAVEIDRESWPRLRMEFPPDRLTMCTPAMRSNSTSPRSGRLARGGQSALQHIDPACCSTSPPRVRRCSDLHFMLQKEVVDRMAAAPATPAYGRLSVMLQYRFDVEPLFGVPPARSGQRPKWIRGGAAATGARSARSRRATRRCWRGS